MSAIEEVLPRVSNIGRIAVVGCLVDEQAKIEVASLVGVLIIQLASYQLRHWLSGFYLLPHQKEALNH